MALPQAAVIAICVLSLTSYAAVAASVQRNSSGTQTLTSGCMYQVKPGDTLHRLSKSLNINMDEVQARNQADLTNASNVRPGESLNIPCPGSSYEQHTPLHIAGCFFDYTIDAQHPTILSIVRNPPNDFPGPYSITGIWTANYQALPEYSIDLTADRQFYVGRQIYLPTCGHSGVIIDSTTPTPPPYNCTLNLSRIIGNSTQYKPKTLREVATALKVRLNTLSALQGGRVQPDEPLSQGIILSIPCPG